MQQPLSLQSVEALPQGQASGAPPLPRTVAASYPEPAWMPPPLPATDWPETPLHRVTIDQSGHHNTLLSWTALAHPDAIPMLLALGMPPPTTHTASAADNGSLGLVPPAPAPIRIHSNSAALLLRLTALLAPEDTGATYNTTPSAIPSAPFCAPSLFRIRLPAATRLLIGPRNYFLADNTFSYIFLCPDRHRRIPEQLGFRWHRGLQAWTTHDTHVAAAVSAFADSDAARYIVRFGVSTPLQAACRGAPLVVPSRKLFYLVTATTGPRALHCPEAGWRGKPPKPCWSTRSALLASHMAAYAPQPLADVLSAMTPDALSRIQSSGIGLLVPEPLPGAGSLPLAPSHPVQFCTECNRPTVALPDKVRVDTKDCARESCASKLPVRTSDLVSHLQAADKPSWRYIAYAAARPLLTGQRHPKPITDDEIRALLPPGSSFRELQPEAVRHCIQNPVSLEADTMGAGKTIISIAVINHVLAQAGPNGRALVVCPAYVLPKWQRDLQRWRHAPPGREHERDRIHLMNSRVTPPATGVLLASYDVHRLNKALHNGTYDIAVFDETQNIKRVTAKRSRAALSVRTRRTVFLSGTPHYNTPSDLFIYLHCAAPAIFASPQQFARAHHIADPRNKTDAETAFLEQLGQFLRDTIMIRRPARLLLADVPEGHPPEILPIPIEHAQRIAEQEHGLLRALASGGDVPSIFAQINALRKLVGELKIPSLKQFLQELANSGQPHLLFTHHRKIANLLHQAATAAGCRSAEITGQLTGKRRDRIANDFQEGRYDSLACTMGSTGAGIDLFRATHVVFAEIDWIPATMSQARGRAIRPGQTQRVRTTYAVADGTIIDPMMATLVASKSHTESVAMGDLSADAVAQMLAADPALQASAAASPLLSGPARSNQSAAAEAQRAAAAAANSSTQEPDSRA